MTKLFFILPLLASCIFEPKRPGDIPDYKRTFVEDVRAGDESVIGSARVFKFKMNNGWVVDIDEEIISVPLMVPKRIANYDFLFDRPALHSCLDFEEWLKVQDDFNFCLAYDLWMKSRKISEPREVPMEVCDKAVKEERASAIAYNIWVRLMLWKENLVPHHNFESYTPMDDYQPPQFKDWEF